MNDQIPCQACDPEAETGCSVCGGYKVVLARGMCSGCGTRYWHRPGVYTSFDGKRWRTFDGLEMVCRPEATRCAACDARLQGSPDA